MSERYLPHTHKATMKKDNTKPCDVCGFIYLESLELECATKECQLYPWNECLRCCAEYAEKGKDE